MKTRETPGGNLEVLDDDGVWRHVPHAAARLYRCHWDQRCFPGYIVYRHVFDETKCDLKDAAMVHKVALFVTQSEAEDYCRYRNDLMDKNGTDALS